MSEYVKFSQGESGDLIISKDLKTIFEIVRSGDVYPQSMSPESNMMKVLFSGDPQWKENQLTIDYFNSDFLGFFDKSKLQDLIDLTNEHFREARQT